MATFVVPKDTIDLIVTAAFIGATHQHTGEEHAHRMLRQADKIGQELWDANYAAVNEARGSRIPTPTYEWEPVFDLIWQPTTQREYSVSMLQAVQIEECRRFVLENSFATSGWDDSPARVFLQQLGEALASRMLQWDPGSLEAGAIAAISGQTEARWTRGAGFPLPHCVED